VGDAQLHVARSGLPAGPDTDAFVLLHGFGASSFTWRHWRGALEQRGHVVMIDLLGFGASPKPSNGPYDPVGQAGLVTEIVRGLGDVPVTLVGHSFGGGVAMLTALALRDLGRPVRRLVIVAGAAYRQRLPPFVHCARYPRTMNVVFRTIGARLMIRQVVRSVVFDPAVVTNDLVEGYAVPLKHPDALGAILACAARIEPAGLDEITSRYPSIDVPTLLLWGRHDRVVPPSIGVRLERALPEARLHLLDRCGHVPQEELPEASLALLTAFLDR
jgi:pimeloyl-ACP methyl ester carboxylesterase